MQNTIFTFTVVIPFIINCFPLSFNFVGVVLLLSKLDLVEQQLKLECTTEERI